MPVLTATTTLSTCSTVVAKLLDKSSNKDIHFHTFFPMPIFCRFPRWNDIRKLGRILPRKNG
jgi:hypothetical protein